MDHDICLPHASVSKLHARLRLVPDGIFVSDTGFANGRCVLQAFKSAQLTALLKRLRLRR